MSKKILVVDDEADIIFLIAYRLGASGYQTITAESGQEALAKVSQEKPDLILLDIMMPEMDGYQVLEHLKADIRTKSIPVIALSAKSAPEEVERAYASGATDFIAKPFSSSDLLKRIAKCLELKNSLA